MKNKLEQLKKSALADLEKAKTAEKLRGFEVEYFGRKGKYNALVKELPKLNPDKRKTAGKFANEIKIEIEKALVKVKLGLENKKLENLAKEEWIDKTLPGEKPKVGHLHLTTQATQEITDIFNRLGFVLRRYPEIEWDWYAFESLNMPKDHPARDEWETFFMDLPEGKKGKIVLTPHTSSGQAREMERGKLPIRMMNISKCYRRQSDVSHVPMFHQFEGLFIDKEVSITHLKGVLDYFARAFFGEGRRTRLRPFHFRFTEPSFEIDVSCDVCGGTGKLAEGPERSRTGEKCRLCKEGWLELGGAGMVHPNVLKAGGIDPKKYNGFAFGWGVERTFMMKEGMKIDDIRLLYKNDLRFLEQF
ncbi:phenylalanine--tRNA ligase subunit alpha [Patescibacteria group bacterium]|nr:phenylalanine--tRNA ligase subunit alpha [Patescibacteria group bacterium]